MLQGLFTKEEDPVGTFLSIFLICLSTDITFPLSARRLILDVWVMFIIVVLSVVGRGYHCFTWRSLGVSKLNEFYPMEYWCIAKNVCVSFLLTIISQITKGIGCLDLHKTVKRELFYFIKIQDLKLFKMPSFYWWRNLFLISFWITRVQSLSQKLSKACLIAANRSKVIQSCMFARKAQGTLRVSHMKSRRFLTVVNFQWYFCELYLIHILITTWSKISPLLRKISRLCFPFEVTAYVHGLFTVCTLALSHNSSAIVRPCQGRGTNNFASKYLFVNFRDESVWIWLFLVSYKSFFIVYVCHPLLRSSSCHCSRAITRNF